MPPDLTPRTAIFVGALGGALVGAVGGFLFLTERGRRVRDELQPRLAELVNEFQRVRLTAERARAREGWRESPSDPGQAPADRPGEGR
jgi:gas vesicle protein